MPRTLEPGDIPAALRGGQLPGIRTPSLPRGRRALPLDSSQGCVGCRRNYSPAPPSTRTSETSFTDGGPRRVPTSLFQGSAPRPSSSASLDDHRTYAHDDSELCTRTSWVDAETAYKQVKRGRAAGNKSALWLRWRLQKQLYSLGCFTQKHCGKVLFLGLLLLSLCCVGLKTATIETNVERLWVEEGGRLEQELAYTRDVLGEGSGSTHEIVIQTPARGANLLSDQSFLLHLRALRIATEISVVLHDRTWHFDDLCFKPSFPSIDEGGFIDGILERLQPCTIVTPLDCFWEASKLLGPKSAVYLPGYPGKPFYWTNLDPNKLVEAIKGFSYAVPISVDAIKEILKRAGITTAYQEKPCLNPYDDRCPTTAPNYQSKQVPDVGAEISGGCAGFAQRYMHWEEELIVGGVQKDKAGKIIRAEAIQSMVLLLGERELFEYHQQDIQSVENAKEILQTWQRKFTEEISKVAMETDDNDTRDHIYPFSSASMLDLLKDFSQMSPVRVGLGYAFMLVYACISMCRWTDPVQSQSGVGMAGVLLVSLSVAAGLGLCSVLGIKFNASTTQIIPFLALGLGVDDMFLIGQTVSENTRKTDIPYMEQTGECLKRVGVSVLITSLSNACAFFMAAIIPIPALRAFCLQAAVLVLFNLATILLVFPAVISLDMLRRDDQKVDVLCCITGSSSRGAVSRTVSRMVRGRTPPPDYFETRPPGYSNPSMHQTITQTTADGTHPVTVLAPPPKYETHGFHNSPATVPPLPPSTTSSQQCLTPEEPETGCHQHCGTNPRELCNWPLMRLARNVIAPLLQKTPVKILVVVVFLVGIVLGIVGTVEVEDGLDITDIVPRDTLEYKFLRAQSQYFGFYNFHVVTKEDIDYPSEQGLLLDYHKAFQRVDKIIKKEDGSLPDFWLALMRDWLLDMQRAFDKDRHAGCIAQEGWFTNASDDGVLGYMLMVQTGHRDRPMDKHRVLHGRLVDELGKIYAPAFYNYLTAWTTVDALAYYASEANLHPPPQAWTYARDHYGNSFLNATTDTTQIPKSKPLIFSQMAFYLHDLGDTAAITETVQEVRGICDRFSELGVPTYPTGIVFTFWEQYLGLRFHLMLALICVLAGIFAVLLVVLLSPWTAAVVVAVLAMMVVELFGFMGMIGIKLSAVPAVILIVSVGIGVEFTVHICLGFLTAIGSRNKRMRMALEHMFGPVIHGAMTTFLGVVMLALSEFDFIVKYFFVVLTALIVIGLLNGLLLLPVLLSVLGPKAEVVPKDQSDYLAPPTPEPTPPPARRERAVRSVSRRVFPRMPSDISLTTITEEQSSQYSSQDSQIAVTVQPEVVVETTLSDGHHGNQSSSSSLNSSPPGSNESTPPPSNSNRHVTTVKATTRVKVQVHRPRQGDECEYKSKRRKSPPKDPEIVEVEMESDEDCSSS